MSVPQFSPDSDHFFATFDMVNADGTHSLMHFGGHWNEPKGAQSYIKTTMNWYAKRLEADEEAAITGNPNRKWVRPPNDAASALNWNRKKLVAAWVTPMKFGNPMLDTRVEFQG